MSGKFVRYHNRAETLRALIVRINVGVFYVKRWIFHERRWKRLGKSTGVTWKTIYLCHLIRKWKIFIKVYCAKKIFILKISSVNFCKILIIFQVTSILIKLLNYKIRNIQVVKNLKLCDIFFAVKYKKLMFKMWIKKKSRSYWFDSLVNRAHDSWSADPEFESRW